MYKSLTVRETACADEKSFVEAYNEYVRRKNSKLSESYIAKAWHEVEMLFEFFTAKCAEWIRYFSISAANHWVRVITPKSKRVTDIIWECEPILRECEQLYLIELLNARGELVWSKVGTTTRSTEKRMEEHLKYYFKDGITAIRVNKVWECDVNAEGFESFFRAYYIRKYPGTFQKNDRFRGVKFDLDEAPAIFDKYVNLMM